MLVIETRRHHGRDERTYVIAGDKHQWTVKVEHRDNGLHSRIENSFDHIIVMINGLLIDRSAGQDKRQDPSPWNGETIVLHAHGRDSLDVLLVQEIVLIGDVVSGLIARDEFFE